MQHTDNNTVHHKLAPDMWVENYGDMLYSFVASRISDKEVAKDIVQDVFVSAWNGRLGYKGEASEKNWLFTITRNKIIDHYRKAANNPLVSIEDKDSEGFFDLENNLHWVNDSKPKDWGVNYTDTIETKEFYKVLSHCKDALQEQQQAVFVMKHMEDLSTKDICKVLNISASNYWVLMHRAKLQLRKCIEKSWFDKY
ncbi:MAG: sigma-70 family RNA polymerase sigma factor [Flavipsychrobacter sp.]